MAARSSTGLIPPPSRPPPTAYVARQRSRHGLPEQIVATPSKIKFEHSFIPVEAPPSAAEPSSSSSTIVHAPSAVDPGWIRAPPVDDENSDALAAEVKRLQQQLEVVQRRLAQQQQRKERRSREKLNGGAAATAGAPAPSSAEEEDVEDSGAYFTSQGDGDEEEEEEDELEGLDSSGASPDVQHGPSYLRNGTLKPTALRIRPESSTRALEEADIDEAQIELDEEDELFDAPRSRYFLGRAADALARVRPRPPKKKKPSKSLAIQLNDPMCDPSTLVYCLFRYRRNTPLVTILLERLEHSQHPEIHSYTLHLCYLMLIEPLASPLEQWLIQRTHTSLHFALQVYWFCQGMIEDHDPRPGATNYKRFLRIQREVQTGVGHQAEQKATDIMSAEMNDQLNNYHSFSKKGKLRSLEATNRALADAMELRSVFHDVTNFVEVVTSISVTLRQTEPRSERDATLIRELERLQATLPNAAHLPSGTVGSFQKVLAILPYEAKSFSTRERNPYMLVLEVSEVVETENGLADSESIASIKKELRTKRSRKQQFTRAMTAPGRVALRAGGKAVKGVANGVGITISKSRAGVGATVDGVRDRKAKHQARREAALAQENDPFAITETDVEKTARMQQAALKERSTNSFHGGRSVTPEAHSGWDGLREGWAERQERIRTQTNLNHVPGWQVAAVLVKADDDLRQEMFCMHLIALFQKAFRREHLDALADGLRPYSIQATSSNSGIIEALPDAVSIAEIKRQMLKRHNSAALEMHYRQRFRTSAHNGKAFTHNGDANGSKPENGSNGSSNGNGNAANGEAAGDGSAQPATVTFEEAQRNCMHSVAGYAVVQYILQLKDRHNGNILIDSSGRMVHIDFAYLLGWAPGGITFEKSAFKLTKDMVDVWGGRGSALWDEFVELVVSGMQAIQTHHELITRDVEVIAASGARFPFLKDVVELGGFEVKGLTKSKKRILQLLRRRFKLYKSPQKLRAYVLTMIDEAYDNFWTRTYAKFQLLTNGIPP